jgi:glycosyltransferase involved in cell wall biosynthesis/GT2 family glycosyltransferase/tetratricopeptide (TPR) repeat protein
MLPGTIVWIAPFYNRSGFGAQARAFVSLLHKGGMRIRTLSVNQVESGIDDCDLALIKSLETTPLIPPITAIVSHVPSMSWLGIQLPEPNLRIIATAFDSSAQGNLPPPEWIAACNKMDQVWLMTEKERDAFVAAGLPSEKIHFVRWPHHWQNNPLLPPITTEPLAPKAHFRLLSIAMFQPRRRWEALIEAYLEEFKGSENVELYLKVNYPSWHPVPGKPRQDLHDLVASLRRKTGSQAPILIDEDLGTRLGIVRLIDSCNVYISTDTAPTAPVAEAWVRQRLVIIPDGLGLGIPNEYIIAIPVDPESKIPMTQGMLLYQPHHRGAFMPLLSVKDVRNAIRRAYDMSPSERQAKGTSASLCVFGPTNAVPEAIRAINAGWQYKEALERDKKEKILIKRLAWEGSQLVRHSLALINRELCLRLIDSGYEVSIIPYENDDIDADADPRFAKIVQRTNNALSGKADVHVRHQWPPKFNPPKEGYWVIMQPWEYGSLPEAWIHPMNAMVDEIWACSSFVRECYIASGIPAERVFVVPAGVDTATFQPNAVPFELSTAKRFKFLFVGGTIFRKGIDILLDAYINTFSDQDDVCLVIKDMGGTSFYKGQTAQQMIGSYQSKPGAPEIEYIEHTLNNKDMAGLYTACDCLVHPYRGEGFGLPIAEAMACELPVIVTGYGAALDFCTPDNAYLLPSKKLRLAEKRIGDLETVDYPWLAEPDKDSLRDTMMHVFAHPEEAQVKGKAARVQIETNFTWEKAAKAVTERLDAIPLKPILRFSKTEQHSKPHVEKLVSIVIRVSTDPKSVERCLHSIKDHTPEPHEIILLAHGSSQKTAKWARKLVRARKDIQYIENSSDLGSVKESNQGIEAALGEYVLLLSGDVVVTANWLSGMLDCLISAPDTGIIGPMTNTADGPQRVIDDTYLSTKNLDACAQRFWGTYRHRRIPVSCVDGFCMLFRRRLVEKIGLLDENLGTGDFADHDLSLRAALGGYRNLIAGDVFVHRQGSRGSTGNRIDSNSAMARSKKTLDEKWSGIEVSSSTARKFIVRKAIEKATEFSHRQQIEKAIEVLTDAIKYAPEDKEIYYRMAQILVEAKLFKEALEALQPMPEGSEDDAKRLELMGYCNEGLDADDEASSYADRALYMHNASAAALNLKGTLAFKKGDRASAEDLFKKSISVDPSYGEAYTNLGVLAWSAGQRDEALRLLERGFVLLPTNSDIINLYHRAITDTGHFERAEQLFFEAKTLYPYNQRIAFLLIDILLQQNKNPEAMQEIQQAMLTFGIDDGIIAAALAVRKNLGAKECDRGASRKVTLSLAMIVKNEDIHIAKCLNSVSSIVDEMIVVDTGSTDRTKDIATAFGAKVYDFAWNNDFAEARNYSLSLATCDWILVIDADEIISPIDHGLLTSVINKNYSRAVAYELTTRNYTTRLNVERWNANDGKYAIEEAGSGWYPSAKVRLFQRDNRIRFVNPIHECVEPAVIKAGILIKPCSIPIHHYGRLGSREKIQKKKEAYYLLSKKKVEEKGDDQQAVYELALVAAELEKFDEAIELWERFFQLDASMPSEFIHSAYINMGSVYAKLGRYQDALNASRKVLELNPDLKEAVVNNANCMIWLDDAEKVIQPLEDLLQKMPDYVPALCVLAVAYTVCADRAKGRECLERLRKKGFDTASYLVDQAKILYALKRIEYAKALLEAALQIRENEEIKRLLEECTKPSGDISDDRPQS